LKVPIESWPSQAKIGVHLEAELQRTLADTNPARNGWREVVFSIADARRALAYVAAVAADASEAFCQAQACRQALQCATGSRLRAALSDRRDDALQRLNSAIDECNAVGADLLDIPSGMVRFSAEVQGKPVSLIWRLGDSLSDAWIDLLDPDDGAHAPSSIYAAAL
jgi:hypothetical protein